MNGVAVMVVTGTLQMFQLMRDRMVMSGRQPSALHRKAMQGQEQQQKDRQESAHRIQTCQLLAIESEP